ncbi:MAG: hypothetical protein ACKVQV_01990 [Bacteroidia bacterium]
MDWWIGGLVDWWIGGLVDWWIGGLVDWWIGGWENGSPDNYREGEWENICREASRWCIGVASLRDGGLINW